MRLLKQNIATNLMVFMSDSLDHTTGKIGLTLAVTTSKDGASFSSIAPVVTERGNGWYNIELTEAMIDTLGDLAFHITATGADATDFLCRIVSGSMDADVSSRLSSASYTAPDNAGIAAIPTNTLLTNDSRLDNLDATISSRSTLTVDDIPEVDNSSIATAVRGELSTELSRIDTTISSRLSSSEYISPDNSTIGLIKTKIDSLENYDDTSINVLLDYIRKITGNKIIRIGNTITIYEDDDTTVWKQYDVSNLGRIEI